MGLEIIRQNGVHVARVENGKINIYEKGLKLEDIDLPEIRLRSNCTEEDVFCFFENSDEYSRVLFTEFSEAFEEMIKQKER